MKLFLSVLVWFGLAAAAAAQTPSYRVGEARQVEWDCVQECNPADVAYFVLVVDGVPQNVGKVLAPGQTSTFRAPLPPLAKGNHSAVVRACNEDDECGPESNTLVFRVRPLVPGAPAAPRLVSPQQAVLSLPRAVTLANCAAEWAIDRPLSGNELQILATLHPPVPPTKETISTLLEAQLSRMGQP